MLLLLVWSKQVARVKGLKFNGIGVLTYVNMSFMFLFSMTGLHNFRAVRVFIEQYLVISDNTIMTLSNHPFFLVYG